MDRRTFIKAAILAAPALCLPQILSGKGFEGRIKEADESPDFVIFFIGGYGSAVSEEFRVLRERNPVIRKCGHISMDISSDKGLVEVKSPDEAGYVLLRVERLNLSMSSQASTMASTGRFRFKVSTSTLPRTGIGFTRTRTRQDTNRDSPPGNTVDLS